MDELASQKKVVIKREGTKWEITFKGDYITGRDFAHIKRALDVRYKLYLRSRAVARRKGVENATV